MKGKFFKNLPRNLIFLFFFFYIYKGENNIGDQYTIEDIESIIHDVPILIDVSEREKKKIKNMNNAVQKIFPDPFKLEFDPNKFTIDLAKEIHSLIGANGLIGDAGNYRKTPAKPAQIDYEYVNVTEIQDKMEQLFKLTRKELMIDLSIEDKVKLGAKFLSIFQAIHPFSNGNGRVGRLLLSYMLSSSCVVPITLYEESSDSNNYLTCIYESQNINPIFGPLAQYILLSIRIDIERYLFLLDIWDEFLNE